VVVVVGAGAAVVVGAGAAVVLASLVGTQAQRCGQLSSPNSHTATASGLQRHACTLGHSPWRGGVSEGRGCSVVVVGRWVVVVGRWAVVVVVAGAAWVEAKAQ
jgi:hypothetical protein